MLVFSISQSISDPLQVLLLKPTGPCLLRARALGSAKHESEFLLHLLAMVLGKLLCFSEFPSHCYDIDLREWEGGGGEREEGEKH